MGWGAAAYKELHSAARKEEEMRLGFNPQYVPMGGSGAVLGWLNTLQVLLSSPAVSQLKVCKVTLVPPTVWAGHKRGPCLGAPNPSPNCPLQVWAPVISGISTQRGCGEGCAGQITLWGLWPGKGNALHYPPLHNTRPVRAPCHGVPVAVPKLAGLRSARPQA